MKLYVLLEEKIIIKRTEINKIKLNSQFIIKIYNQNAQFYVRNNLNQNLNS